MQSQVLQFIRRHQLIRAGERVGVAVSGGADSVCLLFLLLALRDELGCVLSVVHVHHGLRGAEADADAEFVAALAREHKLQFHQRHVDVASLAEVTRQSLEAAGRRARLDFFAALHAGGALDKVATGHTTDDQAETVLQKLLRGTGTRGLAGIFPRSTIAGVTLVRPLLETNRLQVEQYLRELGQEWREDVSNQSSKFQRNRIRHQLLPLLEREFNPSIRDALSITAEIARHEQDFWDFTVAGVMKDLHGRSGALDARAFRQLHPAVQRRVLKSLAPSELDFDHIEQARLFLLDAQSGTREIARGVRLRITREKSGEQRFAFSTEPVAESTSYQVELKLPGEVLLPARGTRLIGRAVDRSEFGVGLSDSLTGRTLTIRNWRPGDRYRPLGRGEAKLKEFFQQLRIPPEDRSTWPVAELDGEIVWVKGLPVADRYAARGANALVIEEVSSKSVSGR